LAAMQKLLSRGQIKKSDRVVVVSTAHGLKFTDFKQNYHEMNLTDFAPSHANPPIELAARYDDVRDRMLQEIDLRFRS